MLGIVVLNFNGLELLKKYLPNIVKHSTNANIYVIDNNSNDGSQSYILNSFPAVKLIKNEKNYGYAEGYNKGLRFVNDEILCLINNDVLVNKNWLKPILNSFAKNPNISIAQPNILNLNKDKYFDYAGAAGGFIDKFGFPYCRGRILNSMEENKNQYYQTKEIFWASGACFFIRKNIFDLLNGFDRDFFMHQEEIDLCWRAFNKNIKVFNIGSSKVYHQGASTLSNKNSKKTYYNFRNSFLMLVKNIPPKGFYFTIIFRILIDVLGFFRFLFIGEFSNSFSLILAYFSIINLFLKKYRQRQKIQNKNLYYAKISIIFNYYILKKTKF